MHIKPGKYQDREGNFFNVIGIAERPEGGAPLVIYQQLSERNAFEFQYLSLEEFTSKKRSGDTMIPRFVSIETYAEPCIHPPTYQD